MVCNWLCNIDFKFKFFGLYCATLCMIYFLFWGDNCTLGINIPFTGHPVQT